MACLEAPGLTSLFHGFYRGIPFWGCPMCLTHGVGRQWPDSEGAAVQNFELREAGFLPPDRFLQPAVPRHTAFKQQGIHRCKDCIDSEP